MSGSKGVLPSIFHLIIKRYSRNAIKLLHNKSNQLKS